MNNIKLKLFSTLIILLLTSNSCAGQMKLGEDILPIDQINMDFDVKQFYSAENRKIDIEDKVKGWRSVGNDTIYTDYEKTEIIGIQYNMGGWNSKDKLAVLGNVYFNPLHMMADQNGRFIALCAVHSTSGEKPYNEIIEFMTAKYMAPEISIKEKSHFSSEKAIQKYATWEFDDKTIIVSQLAIAGHENDKDYTNLIIAFAVNNKYKKALKGKLRSGHWMQLEYGNQR